MTDTTAELLARYDKWDAHKQELHIREGHPDHSPSSSEWADSDDEGVALAHALAHALRQPIKVWTCRVTDVITEEEALVVRLTEDECFEWLRDTYDPNGPLDEPPVAIVSRLGREQSLRIDIDVHEVTR